MKPRDFIGLASRLASATPARSAELRTAVSRAYYATYHVAFEELIKMGCSPSTGSDAHKDVREHLSKSGDAELEKLAGKIANLHNSRRQADYRLEQTAMESQKTVLAIVQGADVLIRNLMSRCASADSKQLAEAIKAGIAIKRK